MKKLIFLSIILSLILSDSFISISAPRNLYRYEITPIDFYNLFRGEIDVQEFCILYPCLCCDCGEKKVVKKTNGPCDETTPIQFKKICCEGTQFREEVFWYCCEEEPLCRCCTFELPCRTTVCPQPYERKSFTVNFNMS